MNSYVKYCTNVFVAVSENQYKTGEVITMTTKYGKEHDAIVFNCVHSRNGLHYYSVVRADGYNSQERAKAKAERLMQWSANASKRSNAAWEASQEGKDFLRLAEPIKVGHHSEKRHRALIDRNWNRMGKSVQEGEKAKDYESRADYWNRMAEKIDLSMPESIEYYEYLVEQKKAYHEGLKSGTIPKQHSYSMAYAKKELNEAIKNLATATKLWKIEETPSINS